MLLKPSPNTTPNNLKKNYLYLTLSCVILYFSSETLPNQWLKPKNLLHLKIKKMPMKEKPPSPQIHLKNYKKIEKKLSLIKSKKFLKNVEIQ